MSVGADDILSGTMAAGGVASAPAAGGDALVGLGGGGRAQHWVAFGPLALLVAPPLWGCGGERAARAWLLHGVLTIGVFLFLLSL